MVNDGWCEFDRKSASREAVAFADATDAVTLELQLSKAAHGKAVPSLRFVCRVCKHLGLKCVQARPQKVAELLMAFYSQLSGDDLRHTDYCLTTCPC